MKSNEVFKAIHENAVAYGWWEEERGFGEIAALIHSELSEALEEYRNGKPFIYKIDGKPEGIAVELADTVIRILDYFGKIGYTVEELSASNPETDDVDETPYQNFGDFVTNCHGDVSAAYDDMNGERNLYLCDCCARIERWFRRNGLDLEEVITIKNEYNKKCGWRLRTPYLLNKEEQRKGLFNMTENKDGFKLGTRFEMGGIKWAIIQTAENSVKCIAAEIVERRAFDEENKNNFSVSGIREYLNGDFLKKIIRAGAPEEAFLPFKIDLTADDGLEDYGFGRVRVGLITCDEYRALRKNIPDVDSWWWTATPDSPINSYVRYVGSDGTLHFINAFYGNYGVRPLCNLKSEILKSFLDGGSEERSAAVKMVQQLSEKWNISEEEIFGRNEE